MNNIDGGIGAFSIAFSLSSIFFLLLVIVPFMLIETWRSLRNERALRQRGAIEPADDVYPLMSLVYPSSFVVMAIEGALRGGPQPPWMLVGFLLFTLSKLLKFYVIAVLGERWTFRVLVLPGAPLVARGLYRFIRHPNYLAVIGELVGTALIMPAPITGALSILAFGLILSKRIAVEERALGLRP